MIINHWLNCKEQLDNYPQGGGGEEGYEKLGNEN